jgi:DNA polymerase-3 subunit epsilon
MRQIVLDTETTGLDPASGDRLVEIACVEIVNTVPTGQFFHAYIDPERDMPDEAYRIHGLSREFLRGKPTFDQVVDEFLNFVEDSQLVIHNAEFDMRFINSELKKSGRESLPMGRVIDTLSIARRKYPGSANSLDALCSRFKIDNSKRTKHGALMDAELLAEVYSELSGGRQVSLVLSSESKSTEPVVSQIVLPRSAPVPTLLDEAQQKTHRSFIETMGSKAIWFRYLPE